ncbi:MAG: hypothetical protein IJT36_02910 [Alphaproteobacteria bacterium]|nr:hypothetical protein [Alphaproteobacteria bacterium]
MKRPQYAYNDEEAYKYLNTYRLLNERLDSIDGNVLRIHFEDFVLHHEREVDRICDFLEISKENIDRSVYDINYSKSRIGLWKQYPNQDLMKHIASELKVYLYEA